jgi:hypothetical protein
LVSLEAKIEKLKREKRQLKAELRKWEQWKYRYFWNDGEQDLYEDVDTIRINDKWEVVDENGNRIQHTTFNYVNR